MTRRWALISFTPLRGGLASGAGSRALADRPFWDGPPALSYLFTLWLRQQQPDLTDLTDGLLVGDALADQAASTLRAGALPLSL